MGTLKETGENQKDIKQSNIANTSEAQSKALLMTAGRKLLL